MAPGAQPAAAAAAALGAGASTGLAPAAPTPLAAGAMAGAAAGASGSGVTGGAKLEASLLANLKKKIQEKAAAPEKLKTTGVAFQAVEEVCGVCTIARLLWDVGKSSSPDYNSVEKSDTKCTWYHAAQESCARMFC